MSTNSPARGPACAALAPLLALRDTGALDPAEEAAVRAHLAGCAACRADADLDARIAASLRRVLLADATNAGTPPLSAEQIIAAATTEDRVSVPDVSAPAHPGAWRRQSIVTPRWLAGVPALAAVLLVAVLAAFIFSSREESGRTGVVPAPTLSPSLAQRTVYVPTDSGLYALRASDGHVRWTFPAGIDHTPIQTMAAVSAVLLDHGTLYVCVTANPNTLAAAQQYSGIFALRASDGKRLWRVPMLFGCVGHLTLADGTLYAIPNPQDTFTQADSALPVVAIRASDGKPLWGTSLPEPGIAGPVVVGDRVVVATISHLIALRRSDGHILWSTPIVPGAQQEGTDPSSYNDSVAITAYGDKLLVLGKRLLTRGDSSHSAAWEANLYLISAADGTHIVRTSVEDDPWSIAYPPVVAGDVVYVQWGAGITALSLSSSTLDQVWRFVPAGAADQNEAMTGAAVAGGVVYTTDLSGVLSESSGKRVMGNCTYAIRASDGHELWRTPTNAGLNARTPAVADGVVFAPAGTTLWALRASDGGVLWRYIPAGGGPVRTPEVG
jgi:outer membrane protein assembly factor BamB